MADRQVVLGLERADAIQGADPVKVIMFKKIRQKKELPVRGAYAYKISVEKRIRYNQLK